MQRVIDILIACALVALTLPLMAIVALAIKLESAGPVLIRSNRRVAGRRIEVLTFRTTARRSGGDRAMSQSGALTRIGSLLCYTRIENLPQLACVLRGDLTLFGSGSDGRSRPKFRL